MNHDVKAALDEFNRGVIRARNAYLFDKSAIYRAAVSRANARAAASRRYRERKAGK